MFEGWETLILKYLMTFCQLKFLTKNGNRCLFLRFKEKKEIPNFLPL